MNLSSIVLEVFDLDTILIFLQEFWSRFFSLSFLLAIMHFSIIKSSLVYTYFNEWSSTVSRNFSVEFTYGLLVGLCSDTIMYSALVLVTSPGGGFRESKRASDLSEVLGVNISPLQVRYSFFFLFFKPRIVLIHCSAYSKEFPTILSLLCEILSFGFWTGCSGPFTI